MRLRFFFILLLAMGPLSYSAYSQPRPNAPRLQKRMELEKLKEIQSTLQLDEQRMQALRPIYSSYHKELSELEHGPGRDMLKADFDSLSTEEAERIIQNHFMQAEKMLSIRKKYFAEFRKVLSPQEIIGLHQAEAEVRRKVMQEFRRRRGGFRD